MVRSARTKLVTLRGNSECLRVFGILSFLSICVERTNAGDEIQIRVEVGFRRIDSQWAVKQENRTPVLHVEGEHMGQWGWFVDSIGIITEMVG